MTTHDFPPTPTAVLPAAAVFLAAVLTAAAACHPRLARRTAAAAVWLVVPWIASACLLTLERSGVPVSGTAVFAVWVGCGLGLVWREVRLQCDPLGRVATFLLCVSVGPNVAYHVFMCPPEAAWRTQCKNTQKNVGLWMHETVEETGRYPDAVVDGTGWRRAFLDRHGGAPEFFVCPTARRRWPEAGGVSAFGLPVGERTAFPGGVGVAVEAVTDGTSNTIVLMEAVGLALPLTEPGDVPVDELPAGVNLRGDAPGQSRGWVSSYHLGGAQVLTGDGRVRFLRETVDADVLRSLVTIAGGERAAEW